MKIFQAGITISLSVEVGPAGLEISCSPELNSQLQPHVTAIRTEIQNRTGVYRGVWSFAGVAPEAGVRFLISNPMCYCPVSVELNELMRKLPDPEQHVVPKQSTRRWQPVGSAPVSVSARESCGGLGLDGTDSADPSTPTIKKKLACPFYKSNPSKYSTCRHESLYVGADVKQHIELAHHRAQYCPICYTEFTGDGASNAYCAHVRARSCRPREEGAVEIEGLHGDLMDRLCEWEPAPTHSVRRQWEEIWAIVFPQAGIPSSSPFMDDEDVEVGGM